MAIRLDSLRFWRRAGEVTQTKVRLDALSEAEKARIESTQVYWDFYTGNHFRYIREQGERLVVMNYCGPIVDKSVSFLFGTPFELTVPKKQTSTLELLNATWQANKKDVLAIEMAQQGGVSGDVFVKVAFDEKKGIVRILVLNSQHVFPIVDPHDYSKMAACRIIYPITDAEGKEATFMEYITSETIREYVNGEEQVARTRPNILGEIPVVHIQNLPVSGLYFGKSDIAELVPVNQEMNEKLTDVSDIINYHSAPVTLIFGALAQKLEKGARKVWSGLPKDGKVENLELKSDLAASNNYIDRLKRAMLELGQTPEIALGAHQAISNTSGVALQVMYQPLMEKTKLKRKTYGQGIKDINRLILKTLEVKAGEKMPGSMPYETDVKFGDPLPKDQLLQRQVEAQDAAIGVTSRAEILRERGLAETDIKRILKEVDADRVAQMNAELEAGQVNAGFGNGPEPQGG